MAHTCGHLVQCITKLTRDKESCIQPVNLQLNELNSGTRAYRISLVHRAQSQLKVAGSPRLLLDVLQPLRARRVALMQFATS